VALIVIRSFCYAVIIGGLLLLASVAVIVLPSSFARAADTCAGFINPRCCCTTGACFEISASDYVRLDETRFRIVRTGMIVEASGRSPDGKARLCTYDYDSDGNIVRIGHPYAKPSCFYFVEPGT
jgi:hypothetical protein